MTKSDLIDWKRHPVTENIFAYLAEREKICVEEVVTNREILTDNVRFYQGYIAALRELLNVDVEDI